MKSYLEYSDEKQIEDISETITQLVFLMDLNEDQTDLLISEENLLIEGKIETLLGKAGLHVKKSKGLVHHFAAAGKGIFKLFLAAIKGDKEGIKDVMGSIKKHDVVEFLLKLDAATLHLVTSPIHIIDAVTGWHIWPQVAGPAKAVTKDIKQKVQNSINFVKTNIQKLIGNNTKKSKKFQGYLATINKGI